MPGVVSPNAAAKKKKRYGTAAGVVANTNWKGWISCGVIQWSGCILCISVGCFQSHLYWKSDCSIAVESIWTGTNTFGLPWQEPLYHHQSRAAVKQRPCLEIKDLNIEICEWFPFTAFLTWVKRSNESIAVKIIFVPLPWYVISATSPCNQGWGNPVVNWTPSDDKDPIAWRPRCWTGIDSSIEHTEFFRQIAKSLVLVRKFNHSTRNISKRMFLHVTKPTTPLP